jgi:acyl-coenzyme A thioesterase PaaI-like protein
VTVTTDPGQMMLQMWERTRRLPLGTQLFSWLLGRRVPYSESIGPVILELEPGHARISMADRPELRNHLHSIHAVAMANLGELTSGLAMITALPAGVRAIVVSLHTDYLKKARGTLIAESRVTLPAIHGDLEHVVEAEIRDAALDVVARATVRWRLGRA